jgi:spermidine/putrescine transport system ATP-binding protein
MKDVELKNITKSFNGEVVLKDLNLSIPRGKFFALLGPSGSGKTTLLRLIAGFEEPDKGAIYMGDTDITAVPSNERRVNTVFQHYALFPHMNVFDNVAYGLKIKDVPDEVIQKRVRTILNKVGLVQHRFKSVSQLSGGQQQRVALARAIINEPELLLLDEPLAALDAKLREKMLLELIELQSELGTTFVYVTHDQSEALTVADSMAILSPQGVIEQVGTPEQVYEFPATSFVANFVGATNLFEGVLDIKDEVPKIDIPELGVFEVVLPKTHTWADGHTVLMSLRPEKVMISKKPLQRFSNSVDGIVKSIAYRGRSTIYNVQVNGNLIQVFEQNDEHFPQEVIDYDDPVHLYWQKDNVVLLKQ